MAMLMIAGLACRGVLCRDFTVLCVGDFFFVLHFMLRTLYNMIASLFV